MLCRIELIIPVFIWNPMSSRERYSMICKDHEQLKKNLSSNAVTSMITELKKPEALQGDSYIAFTS